MTRTKQVTAVRKTIAKAKKSPAFTDAHASLAAVALGIAEQIDAINELGDEPVPSALWKELRSAAESLAAVAAEVADDPERDGAASVGLSQVGN